MWFALAMLAATSALTPRATGPAEAIRLADSASANGVEGRFEIIVASAKRGADAVFLDSSTDYRTPANLTFRVRPIVAKALSKHFGAPPETYLLGKTVTVHGIVRRVPAYRVVAGRPRDLARVGHTVAIDQTWQIISIR